MPSGINFHSDKDKRSLAHQYVERLKNANIKVAAITDYNGIREEWLELIKKEAEKNDIHILPGVELSLEHPKYGLHILLIFEKEVDMCSPEIFDFINPTSHSQPPHQKA